VSKDVNNTNVKFLVLRIIE